MTTDRPATAGLREALRPIVADWFDTGYEEGHLDSDVLMDRVLAALAAAEPTTGLDVDRLLDAANNIAEASGSLIQWHVDQGWWQLPDGPVAYLRAVAAEYAAASRGGSEEAADVADICPSCGSSRCVGRIKWEVCQYEYSARLAGSEEAG